MTETPLHPASRVGPADEATDADRPFRPARSLPMPLSAMAFWVAIALPALYIPLLFTGLSTPTDLLTFLGLFGLHAVALVGGRSYRRD